MKYFSALFFTVALVWTWNVIHSSPNISFETHSGIQDEVSSLLERTVKEKKPDATDIQIENIWSESMGTDRVKVHFVYSFKAPDGPGGPLYTTRISGQGLFQRKEDDGTGLDKWTSVEMRVNNEAMVMGDAMVVTKNSDEPAAPAEETKTEPAKTEKPEAEKNTPKPHHNNDDDSDD